MKCLTTEEARVWCEAHRLKVSMNQYLYYESEKLHSFGVVIEDKASVVIALANQLVPIREGDTFGGALIWIRERGIWDDHCENTADMIVRQMRLAAGERESLKKRPGHLFGTEELYEMHSFFAVPLLFGWDAFLIPEGRDYFVFVSHDGLAAAVCRTQEIYEELYKYVLAWNPQEDKGWYLKGVER